MKVNESKLKEYKAILAVLNKNIGVIEADLAIDIRSIVEARIKVLDVYNLFGIGLTRPPASFSTNYCRVSDHITMAKYGEAHRRTISWSDDDRQPDDEWLYQISFPTGAFIFGEHYPQETYQKFFLELKTYKPKYADTKNNNLYFSPSNASKVHEDFDSIFKKYGQMAREEVIKKIIADKEAELARLKGVDE